jgi:DNA-directed RNA polymerase subunit RPC12/RpoP
MLDKTQNAEKYSAAEIFCPNCGRHMLLIKRRMEPDAVNRGTRIYICLTCNTEEHRADSLVDHEKSPA